MRRRHSPLGRRLVKVSGEGRAETGRSGGRGAEVEKTALFNVYILLNVLLYGNFRKKWFGRHKAAADSSGSAPVSALPVLFRAFGPAYSLSSVLWVALTVLYFARLETHLVFSRKINLRILIFSLFKSPAGEPPDHLRDERRAAVEGLLLHRPHDRHHHRSHHTELPIFLPGIYCYLIYINFLFFCVETRFVLA